MDRPNIGDLVKTVYRKEYAVVVAVTTPLLKERGFEWGTQHIYPSDGYRGCQPRKYIKEVVYAGAK
jgi:hypothetical protein